MHKYKAGMLYSWSILLAVDWYDRCKQTMVKHIDGLVQDCTISSGDATVLHWAIDMLYWIGVTLKSEFCIKQLDEICLES